jgi:hypothetical protein
VGFGPAAHVCRTGKIAESAGAFGLERLVDYSYADYAQQKLGPFAIENKDSKTPGCR